MDALDKLLDRLPGGCRYIVGEMDEDWRYCGEPRRRNADGTLGRMAYCDRHWRECVRSSYIPKQKSTSEKYRRNTDEIAEKYLLDEEAA